MRIGLLGGTFDPVHNGHTYLAGEVKKRLLLSKVIFIPAYIPPHKDKTFITPPQDRLKMLKLALEGRKGFALSDVEIKRRGKSYTVDTIKFFRRKYGNTARIFFITGSDSLRIIDKWKRLTDMTKICEFVVIKRPGFSLKKTRKAFTVMDIHAKDISSSEIRKKAAKGETLKGLLPVKVARYIKKHRLYNRPSHVG